MLRCPIWGIGESCLTTLLCKTQEEKRSHLLADVLNIPLKVPILSPKEAMVAAGDSEWSANIAVTKVAVVADEHVVTVELLLRSWGKQTAKLKSGNPQVPKQL